MYQQRNNKAGADGEKRSGIKHDTGVTKKTDKARNGNEDCAGIRYKGGGDYMNGQEKAKNPHRGAKEDKEK